MLALSFLLQLQSLGSHSFKFTGRDHGLRRQAVLGKQSPGLWEASLFWLAAMADLVVCVQMGAGVLGAESISCQHHPSLKIPPERGSRPPFSPMSGARHISFPGVTLLLGMSLGSSSSLLCIST